MWFKVDDSLAFHPKTVAAGNTAIGLWARAGAWSGKYLTDGFIPDDIAISLGTKAAADRLVKVGLWDRITTAGRRGYQFHEWDERNPTKQNLTDLGKVGNVGNHRRWHVLRGIHVPTCPWCNTEDSASGGDPNPNP